MDYDFVLCLTDFGKILENFAVVNIENKCYMLLDVRVIRYLTYRAEYPVDCGLLGNQIARETLSSNNISIRSEKSAEMVNHNHSNSFRGKILLLKKYIYIVRSCALMTKEQTIEKLEAYYYSNLQLQ